MGFWSFRVQLKRNLINSWWQSFVEQPANIYGLDSAILMNPQVWQASGHTTGFIDFWIEDKKTNQAWRIDQFLQEQKLADLSIEEVNNLIAAG